MSSRFLLVIEVLTVLLQLHEVVINFRITIFEAILKFPAVRRFNNMCKETKVIAEREERILMNFKLSFRIKISQYSPVLP